MTGLRIFIAGVGLALAIVAFRAIMQTETLEDFWFETQALLDQPWGLVSVADLYAGFLLTAIVMALVEGSVIAGALWAAPLLLLGNVWTAVWLAFRLPGLLARFKRPTNPNS
jgi:hypothetical protein